jgi:TonB family protein
MKAYVLAGLLLLLLASTSKAQTDEKPPLAILWEGSLRQQVVKAVTPDFPEEAKAAGAHGLVIVAVHFDAEGDFVNAKVLESPHRAITEAVLAALKEWKIKPVVFQWYGVSRAQGELRFVYVNKDGETHVDTLSHDEQWKLSPQYRKIDLQFRDEWPKPAPKESPASDAPNNGMHPTRDTSDFINLQGLGRAGDAGR